MRADNGTRTRGLNLGKVALYQLSYVRMFSAVHCLSTSIYYNHICVICKSACRGVSDAAGYTANNPEARRFSFRIQAFTLGGSVMRQYDFVIHLKRM